MKRMLSLLVVLALVLSMVPNVFATSTFDDNDPNGNVDFDELLGKYDRVAEIDQIAVSLAEGSEGQTYVWTPSEDGTLSMYASDVPEGAEVDFVVTQGENVAIYSEGVDGTATIEVVAGKDVSIEVFEANAAAAEFTLYGTFTTLPGTEGNPIWPEFVWNEAQTEATATVTAPVGTTYYAVWGAGMELTINDGEPTVLTVDGIGRVPAVFTIVNEGEAEAEYSLKIAYPAGHQMNPAATELGWVDVSLAEGDTDGYYYTYTAEATGTITLYIGSITEGAEGDIVLFNNTTYESLSLSEDGVDNYGLEVSMDVTEGDVVTIQVLALPDANYVYPAADITWVGNFAYPLGSEQNPIVPVWTWNEEQTEATATVTAPVGTSYYQVYNAAGMLLSINDGEAITLTTSPLLRGACIFTIVNEGEAEAEYSLKLSYPVGHQMNPEVTYLGWSDVSLAEGDYDGYYYTYTAEGTGTITLYIGSITEGVEGDIVLYNNNTYVQKSLSADGVDNYGMEVSMDVTEGDVISIQVLVLPDENYNYPAADITWVGNFAYPAGSEQNPIVPVWTWNEDNTEATATVTAPVGTTYYQVYNADGMLLSINDGEAITLTTSPLLRGACIFTIVNEGEAEAEYSLKLSYPVGHQMNPEATTLGEVVVSLAEGDYDGYYYTYVAEGTGTVTAYIGSIPEGVEGDIVLYNNNTYVQKSLSADGVDNNVSMDVTEGDVISIQVLVLPDENYNYPAADITWVGNFAEPVEAPIVITTQPADMSVETYEEDVFTVVAEGNGLTYQWQYSDDAGASWKNTTMTGYNTNALTVKAIASRDGYLYRCLITDADGNQLASDGAVLTVTPSTKVGEITANPVDVENVAGYNAVFTVAGENIESYRWQWRRNEDAPWVYTTLPGYATNELTVWSIVARSGRQYRCRMVALNGAVLYTEPATLTVNPSIYINAQPTRQIAAINETGYFSVEAEGVAMGDDAVNLTYQWIYRTSAEDTTWKNTQLTGYNTPNLEVTALLARNGYQYRCAITDAHGIKVYSNVATLSVIGFTTNPKDQTAASGTDAVFSVVAAGADLTYRWQYSKNGGASWSNTSLTGYNTDTLTVGALESRNGYLYRCGITDANGVKAYSQPATLTVTEPVAITAQPGDQTAAVGENALFTVVATGDIASYKWYYSKDGGTTWIATTMAGYNTETLTVGAIAGRNGYQYRCTITDVAGNVTYTEPATLTVG